MSDRAPDGDPHRFDDHYHGLEAVLDGFEKLLEDKGPGLEDMGYREADAAYQAVQELDWFCNYGEGYARRIRTLQDRLAERVDRDPREYPADRP